MITFPHFLFAARPCGPSLAPDNGQSDLARFRDTGLRSSTASAAVSEMEELLRVMPAGKEKVGAPDGPEDSLKLRNIDTGEDIALAEIEKRVPPSVDPGELFRTKDLP